MTDEERERLRLTLEGMANAAWPKHPKASAGDLVAPCRRVVAEMDKRRRAQAHQRRHEGHGGIQEEWVCVSGTRPLLLERAPICK